MLILDRTAQQQIGRLIRRVLEHPVPRAAVKRQIRQSQRGQAVALDPGRCVMIDEGYLAWFCFEDAPGFGLCRHLAVSRAKGPPPRVAVETLAREFGMSARLGEFPIWIDRVAGRGRAVHLIEPLTLLNSSGLSLPPIISAMLFEDVVRPPPDEEDEEAAA
jgi:hypothetical protein